MIGLIWCGYLFGLDGWLLIGHSAGCPDFTRMTEGGLNTILESGAENHRICSMTTKITKK